MAMTTTNADRSAGRSGWAIGGMIFAATIMLVIGVFQILMGIAAIARNAFFFRPAHYPYSISTTGWGWIHLIIGVLVVLTALGLYRGETWARIVGIGIVALAAIDNFLFLPYYPLWSIVLIGLDVWVIWALAKGPGPADNDVYSRT
jgi:hypothetical protein